MLMKARKGQNRWSGQVWLMAVSLWLGSCANFVQTDVETEWVKLQQGDYELDPRHATLLFKVNHMGLSTFVGRFNQFDASLSFDPGDPAATTLDAVVYTTSLDVNDADFAETLKGSSWFDCDQFPHARFRTTNVVFLGEGKVRFSGDLTLLGTTAPIILDGVFNGGAFNRLTGRYTLGFSASGTIQRSLFGMDKYVPLVGDAVEVEVYAEFLRR